MWLGYQFKLNEVDNKLFIYYNRNLIATHEISNKKFNYLEEHYKEGLSSYAEVLYFVAGLMAGIEVEKPSEVAEKIFEIISK